MATKLRHISGDNLKVLEKQYEGITSANVFQQLTKDGGTWFIHFLLQGIVDEPSKVKKVVAKKTKTLKS